MLKMRFLTTLTIMSVVMAPPGAELLGHKKYKNCEHLYEHSKIRHSLVITTESGKVKGNREVGANGCPVDMWWGIPYAEPPVGELRFKKPVPISSWRKILKARNKPNACTQLPDTTYPGFSGAEMWNPNTLISEDCLYLNIAVPTPRPNNSAVLLWIYGGSFFSGSASLDIYDPKVLASEENIIVVSIQYRVGSLGFLYLGTEDAPGNQGLLDQRLAMKWVKDNIQYFGGNKDNITLFSESAGSASVAFQLLSPGSREYFSQAILQSAAATNPWGMVTRKEGQLRALRLAENSNCPHYGDDLSATAYCLRNADANQLANNEFNGIVFGICGFPFTPVLDGHFFPESPRKALSRKNYKMAKILLGSNMDEGNYFNIYYLGDILKREDPISLNRSTFERSVFELNVFVPPVGKHAIEFEYTNWLHPNNSSQLIDAMDKMVGDYQFTCPVLEFAQAYATTRNDVYLYFFNHRSSQNLWPEWCGVMHADEINFIFGEPFNKTHFTYTEEEVKLSKTMMSYWANFAKTGNPNIFSNGSWARVYWPLHTSRGQEYLELSTKNMTQRKGHRSRKCAFWNSYLPNLIENSPSSNGKDGQCTLANGASIKATEPCPEPLITCNSIASKEQENGNDKNITVDVIKVVPFHETRFYVPSSYSAGPDPKRASMHTSSSYMSTVNIILIIVLVIMCTGLVAVLS